MIFIEIFFSNFCHKVINFRSRKQWWVLRFVDNVLQQYIFQNYFIIDCVLQSCSVIFFATWFILFMYRARLRLEHQT